MAKASAPSPTKNTCLLFSMTRRARNTGLRTQFTLAMAPERSVAPSMMDASNSCVAALVNTAPWPALNNGQSSKRRTASVTASMALPPLASTAWPAVRMDSRAARYSCSFSGDMAARDIAPAPP
ncbi:hypothetical protein D9M71_717290 [compost metagenome]